MKSRTVVAASLLIAGCISIGERYASLDCDCPRDKPPSYLVALHAPTGEWGCSPHGGIYREIAWISVRLPEKPRARARYDAAQVTVFDKSPSPAVQIDVTSGYIEIDSEREIVVVALQTPSGALWANGTYPKR